MLRRLLPPFGFLLKSMEDVDRLGELDGVDRTVSVAIFCKSLGGLLFRSLSGKVALPVPAEIH